MMRCVTVERNLPFREPRRSAYMNGIILPSSVAEFMIGSYKGKMSDCFKNKIRQRNKGTRTYQVASYVLGNAMQICVQLEVED